MKEDRISFLERGSETVKLGLMSSILEFMPFEEMIEFVSDAGLSCTEVACWPNSKAERRYAGVSHIDCAALTEEKAAYISEYCKKRNVTISALAFYPNMLDPEPEKRKENIVHLCKVIDAAALLDVNLVTTFIGRIPYKNVDENMKEAEAVWGRIMEYAEYKKVRIGIENCPMLFTNAEWPGGQNIMTSPANWRRIFKLIDSEYLGLNFDPSHFVWQQMDYIKPIYEFKDKLFHVHFKDIKLYRDRLSDVGIMAAPLQYMAPKIPGLGDVDWSKFISALTDVGYKGYACMEIEDRAFEDSQESIKESIRIAARYLRAYL